MSVARKGSFRSARVQGAHCWIALVLATVGAAVAAEPAPAEPKAPYPNVVAAVEAQPNGRLVAAGYAACGCQKERMFVARFRNGGKPDKSFGKHTGYTVIPKPLDRGTVVGLARQSGGRIVVGFNTAPATGVGQLVLARVTSSGKLDRTFGTGGFATLANDAFFASGIGSGVAVAGDGAVIVSGQEPTARMFAAARFSPDGALDTSFGAGGIAAVRADPADQTESAAAVALRPGGEIVLAGGTGPQSGVLNPGKGAFGVAQLLPTGSPDPGFSGDGRTLVAALPSSAESPGVGASAVVLAPDGSVALAGSRSGSFHPCGNFTVARLLADGQADPGFGQDGVIVNGTPGCQGASDLVLTADGRLVVTGPSFMDVTEQAVVGAYDEAGGPLFGGTGLTLFQFGGLDTRTQALALAPGGQPLVGGSVVSDRCALGVGKRVFTCGAATVIRLLPSGELDPAFHHDGATTMPGLCERIVGSRCRKLG